MTSKKRLLISTLSLALATAGYAVGSWAQEGQPPGAPMAQTGTQPGVSILNMKAGEIAGREVYNSEGKELGKVDSVGRERDTGKLSAIVSVGGFLGLGGSKVAIPLDQLSLREDKLTATTALSKSELRKEASKYKEEKYEVIAKDTTLSQVAPSSTAGAGTAGSGTAQGAMRFQSLDADADGYVSQDEARSDQTLTSRWTSVDKNGDGRLDRSEFSAFEETLMRPDMREESGDEMRSREPSRSGGAAPSDAPAPSGDVPPPSQ